MYPSVDIFLPVCGEPLEVLHNTWVHVNRLADSYQGVVKTYVLDDAAEEEVGAMARDFGFHYVVRPNRGWFKKAGNLNHAFEKTDGDHILILDADFAPRADLLDELLPHMDDDEKFAIVQSPQFFRIVDGQNWIERGAGAVQEQFYRSVQTSREDLDGSICVGSCAVYRRAALEQTNGITLIEHSEDMYTGFDLRALGWKLRYVPVALSAGVCPDTAGAFHNQQYRWCMGSLELLTSRRFWRWTSSSRPGSAMCRFLYYLQTALATFIAPVIPLALMILRPDLLRAEAALWVLPSVAYVTLVLPLWHRAPYRLEAWAVRIMYGWSHVFAVWDVLRGRPMGWKPTGSAGAKKNGMRRYWNCMIFWTGGTAVVWVIVAAWRMLTLYPPDFALMLSAASSTPWSSAVSSCSRVPRKCRKRPHEFLRTPSAGIPSRAGARRHAPRRCAAGRVQHLLRGGPRPVRARAGREAAGRGHRRGHRARQAGAAVRRAVAAGPEEEVPGRGSRRCSRQVEGRRGLRERAGKKPNLMSSTPPGATSTSKSS